MLDVAGVLGIIRATTFSRSLLYAAGFFASAFCTFSIALFRANFALIIMLSRWAAGLSELSLSGFEAPS